MTYPTHVVLLPQLADPEQMAATKMAVVIDTLRFTTTACQALQAGAAEVLAVGEVAEAFRVKATLPENTLLCGERHCTPIEGFDLGNSPLEYTPEAVAGKRLIFTTTNGTKAVAAASHVEQIALGALTNRTAVCQRITRLPAGSRITIVCSGTDGHVAMEDVLAAGAILAAQSDQAQMPLQPVGDSALLALAAWQAIAPKTHQPPTSDPQNTELQNTINHIEAEFGKYLGGANLVTSGYAADLAFAAQVDSSECVGLSITADTPAASSTLSQEFVPPRHFRREA